MALFNTNQRHAAFACRRVHTNVVIHDGDAVVCPKGRRAEVRTPERRWPRPFDERRLGLLVFRPIGVAAATQIAPMVGGRPVSPRPRADARLRPGPPRWAARAIGTATSRAGRVAHLDVAAAARHLGLELAAGTPRRAEDLGQCRTLSYPPPHDNKPTLSPHDLRSTGWTQAAHPTPQWL